MTFSISSAPCCKKYFYYKIYKFINIIYYTVIETEHAEYDFIATYGLFCIILDFYNYKIRIPTMLLGFQIKTLS